jgi:hypothetical protein
MPKEIPWKKREITVDVNNVIVKAEVVWWAKDYFIEIHEPDRRTIPGKHMLYMIPATYVFDTSETENTPGPTVPIIEKCKKMIISEYS